MSLRTIDRLWNLLRLICFVLIIVHVWHNKWLVVAAVITIIDLNYTERRV